MVRRIGKDKQVLRGINLRNPQGLGHIICGDKYYRASYDETFNKYECSHSGVNTKYIRARTKTDIPASRFKGLVPTAVLLNIFQAAASKVEIAMLNTNILQEIVIKDEEEWLIAFYREKAWQRG